MKALAVMALSVLLGASASAAERIYTPEGWYQIEDGEGPAPDSDQMAFLIVEGGDSVQIAQLDQPQAAPQAPAPSPEPAPALDEEIARFRQLDCQRVRGLYLRRILELHGLDVGLIDPEALAALTWKRPEQRGSGPCFGGVGCLPSPALAPLYGEPPVPPGELSYDFTLKQLFAQLMECTQQERASARQAQPPAPPQQCPQTPQPPQQGTPPQRQPTSL
jgi:hypothetical protein